MVRLWDESQGARIYNVNRVSVSQARSSGPSREARFLLQGLWLRDMLAERHEYDALVLETKTLRHTAARIIAGEY